MALHPLCGGNVQKASKIIAILEILWFGFNFLGVCVFWTLLKVLGPSNVLSVTVAVPLDEEEIDEEEMDKIEEQKRTQVAVSSLIYICLLFVGLFCLLHVVMGVKLLKGVNTGQSRKLKSWMAVILVLWVSSALGIALGFLVGYQMISIIPIVTLVVEAYFLWIVDTCYVQFLTQENHEIATGYLAENNKKYAY